MSQSLLPDFSNNSNHKRIVAFLIFFTWGLTSNQSFRRFLLSLCLDSRFINHVCVLFFFFFSRVLEKRGYCSLNSNHKCWLFCSKQCISVLFMDPQIPLFSNFFIKNGSHGTIYTFKNYFTTVFSVFSFSKISSIQIDP